MDIPPPPDGDRNKGPGMLAATIFITNLALITVVLRMYARYFILHNVGWDDHTIVIAMASESLWLMRASSADSE